MVVEPTQAQTAHFTQLTSGDVAVTDHPRGLPPPLLTALSVVAGAALAWLGGLILGEYPFVGDGVQWLPILGGAGLGAAVAWVVNRVWRGAPPVWMAGVAAVLAVWGEVRAVQEDTPDGVAWPAEGWAAIAAAGAVAAYGVLSSARGRQSS